MVSCSSMTRLFTADMDPCLGPTDNKAMWLIMCLLWAHIHYVSSCCFKFQIRLGECFWSLHLPCFLFFGFDWIHWVKSRLCRMLVMEFFVFGSHVVYNMIQYGRHTEFESVFVFHQWEVRETNLWASPSELDALKMRWPFSNLTPTLNPRIYACQYQEFLMHDSGSIGLHLLHDWVMYMLCVTYA